ncbi:MAG: hypothetical protein IPP13_12390 [Kouleothrix sp.]|nr:hypothetical protein [Kouleothrix sp.]
MELIKPMRAGMPRRRQRVVGQHERAAGRLRRQGQRLHGSGALRERGRDITDVHGQNAAGVAAHDLAIDLGSSLATVADQYERQRR